MVITLQSLRMPFSPSRYGHTLTQANIESTDRLVLFGGRAAKGFCSSELLIFDYAKSEWLHSNFDKQSLSTQQKDTTTDTQLLQPPGRYFHTAVWYDGALYVYAGKSNHCYLNDLWRCRIRQVAESDRTTNFSYTYEWTLIKTGGQVPTGRCGHSAVVYGDHMYIFGGIDEHGVVSDQLHKYSFATCVWESVAAVGGIGASPMPCFHHSCVVHENTMVVFGGHLHNRNIAVYTFETNTWDFPECKLLSSNNQQQQLIDIPSLFGHTATVINHHYMYILGGYVSTKQLTAFAAAVASTTATASSPIGDAADAHGSFGEHDDQFDLELDDDSSVGDSNRRLSRRRSSKHRESLIRKGSQSDHPEHFDDPADVFETGVVDNSDLFIVDLRTFEWQRVGKQQRAQLPEARHFHCAALLPRSSSSTSNTPSDEVDSDSGTPKEWPVSANLFIVYGGKTANQTAVLNDVYRIKYDATDETYTPQVLTPVENFDPILNTRDFSDVTFVVSTGTSQHKSHIYAHKMILNTKSDFFHDLLYHVGRPNRTVMAMSPKRERFTIPSAIKVEYDDQSKALVYTHGDFSYSAIYAMLHYIYTDRIDLANVTVTLELLRLAQLYHLRNLRTACEQRLMSAINLTTLAAIRRAATEVASESLLAECDQFVDSARTLASATESLKRIPEPTTAGSLSTAALFNILAFLDIADLAVAEQVSKRWAALIHRKWNQSEVESPTHLWKHLVLSHTLYPRYQSQIASKRPLVDYKYEAAYFFTKQRALTAAKQRLAERRKLFESFALHNSVEAAMSSPRFGALGSRSRSSSTASSPITTTPTPQYHFAKSSPPTSVSPTPLMAAVLNRERSASVISPRSRASISSEGVTPPRLMPSSPKSPQSLLMQQYSRQRAQSNVEESQLATSPTRPLPHTLPTRPRSSSQFSQAYIMAAVNNSPASLSTSPSEKPVTPRASSLTISPLALQLAQPSPASVVRPVRIAVLGDAASGKSSLIASFAHGGVFIDHPVDSDFVVNMSSDVHGFEVQGHSGIKYLRYPNSGIEVPVTSINVVATPFSTNSSSTDKKFSTATELLQQQQQVLSGTRSRSSSNAAAGIPLNLNLNSLSLASGSPPTAAAATAAATQSPSMTTAANGSEQQQPMAVPCAVTVFELSAGAFSSGDCVVRETLQSLYTEFDAFLIVFSTTSKSSYLNAEKWCAEVNTYAPNVTRLIVGTKYDAVFDPSLANTNFITHEMGKQLAQRVGANGYIGCSAKFDLGVQDVFYQVLALTLENPCVDRDESSLLDGDFAGRDPRHIMRKRRMSYCSLQ